VRHADLIRIVVLEHADRRALALDVGIVRVVMPRNEADRLGEEAQRGLEVGDMHERGDLDGDVGYAGIPQRFGRAILATTEPRRALAFPRACA
jgi:hypothetical protein